MEIRHLRCFVAVAEELHFGRAAARLHMAQPPLSQQIKLLERELGTQLFTRSSRRVTLTDTGNALLSHARRILEEEKDAKRVVGAARLGHIGHLRIGFAGTTAYGVIPQLSRAVAEIHPGIELEMRSQIYSGEAQAMIESGEIDLGFIGLPSWGGLRQRQLKTENLICALPDTHPLAASAQVAVADLAGDAFVAFRQSRRSAVSELTSRVCQDAGFTPRIAQEAPDPYGLMTMVAAELGVAMVLESASRTRFDHVVFRPLVPAASLDVGFVWSAANASPTLRIVLDVAAEIFASD